MQYCASPLKAVISLTILYSARVGDSKKSDPLDHGKSDLTGCGHRRRFHISLAEPHDSAAVKGCVAAAYALRVERIERELGPMSPTNEFAE